MVYYYYYYFFFLLILLALFFYNAKDVEMEIRAAGLYTTIPKYAASRVGCLLLFALLRFSQQLDKCL